MQLSIKSFFTENGNRCFARTRGDQRLRGRRRCPSISSESSRRPQSIRDIFQQEENGGRCGTSNLSEISNSIEIDDISNGMLEVSQRQEVECRDAMSEELVASDIDKMEIDSEKVGNNFLEMFPGSYFHDIVRSAIIDEYGTIRNFITRLRQTEFRGEVFILSKHGEHFHIIHDCPYSGNRCRCARIEICKGFRRRTSRTIICKSELTFERNQYIGIYVCTGEREVVFAEVSGRRFGRVYHSTQSILDIRNRSSRSQPMVEEGDVQDASSIAFLQTGDCGSNVGYDSRPQEQIGEHGRCTSEREPGLLQFLKANPFSPIQLVLDSELWFSSKYRYIIDRRKLDPMFVAFNHFFCNKNLFEIYEYAMSVNVRYGCITENLDSMYYDVEESIEIIKKLLMYQLEDLELVKQFMLDLYNVLEKKISKLNSLCIISPPSAGKNFFIDLV